MQSFKPDKNTFNSQPKMPYLGSFTLQFRKKPCHIWNQHSQIVKIQSLKQNKKSLNSAAKLPYLGNFMLQFGKNLVIFETSTSKFAKTQSFKQLRYFETFKYFNFLKFESKISLLIFLDRNIKNLLPYLKLECALNAPLSTFFFWRPRPSESS